MKYLKNFSEALESDFSKLTSDVESGGLIKRFTNLLKGVDKSEFMYRITDGEDLTSLIKEFLDRGCVSEFDDFEFRVLVMDSEIKEIESRFDMSKRAGIDICYLAVRNGIERTCDEIYQTVSSANLDINLIISHLEDAISYLSQCQKVYNWAYRGKRNINGDKILAGKGVVNKLKSGNETY